MSRLKRYNWIGPEWTIFGKGRHVYNLDTITDDMVEKLLREDPRYWEHKFEPVAGKKKKKSLEKASEEPPPIEKAEEDCGCGQK